MNLNFQISNYGISKILTAVAGCFLALLSSTSIALGQEATSSSQILQEQFIAQLAAGDEEQRLNAITQLIGLFDAAPNSATPQVFVSVTNTLQRDSSPLVRALSARAFETCCGEQAVPNLLASLANEREVAVRKAIIYSLARYRSSPITPALIPLLKDKAPEIRGVTAFALAEIGDAISLDAMLEILQKRQKDEDAFARSQAARALGRIGNHSAMEILVKSLHRDKSPEVRREAAYALGLIANKQDAKAIETLREASLQADPYLAGIAGEALDKVNLRNP